MLRLYNQLISLKLLILPVFDGQIFYLSEEWKRQITIPLFARLVTNFVIRKPGIQENSKNPLFHFNSCLHRFLIISKPGIQESMRHFR